MNILTSLRTAMKQFLEIPAAPAGIVVRPDCFIAVNSLVRTSIQYQPFGAVPIYVDSHQPEPYLEFTDDLTLRAYLTRFECAAYDKLLLGEPRDEVRAELLAYYDQVEGVC